MGEAGIGRSSWLAHTCANGEQPSLWGGGLQTLCHRQFLALERALRQAVEPTTAVAQVASALGEDGVLVLDDLQWADPATLELLPALAEVATLVLAVRAGDPGEPAAVAAALAAGAELVPVEPLDDEAAAALVRRHRADLDDAAVDRIVADAGGNPSAIEQLAVHGRLDDSLEAALRARVDGCGPDVREVLALLGVAGRPMPAAELGGGVAPAVEARLVTLDGDRARLRGAVFGRAAVDALDDAGRAAVHRELAGMCDEPGERARHLAGAGDRTAALPLALEAAGASTSALDRSVQLELASSCADGDEAVELVALAAATAVEAGDDRRALQLAETAAAGAGPPLLDDALATVAEARLRTGDPDGAIAAAEQVTEHAPPAARGRAAAVRAAATAWPLWRPDASLDACAQAEQAAAGPDGDVALPVIRTARARARLVAGDPGWRDGAAGATLVWGQVLAGDATGPVTPASAPPAPGTSGSDPAIAAAAIELHRRAGCDEAAIDLRRLVERTARPVDREVGLAHLALALADSGRTGAAADTASQALDQACTPAGRALLAWSLVEAEWAAGRLTRCRKAAEDALGILDAAFPTDVLVALAAAWASLTPGDEVAVPPSLPSAPWPALAPATDEHAGICALVDGNPGLAATAFATAAAGWAPVHRRGALRCRWASADATLAAGDRDTAIEALRAVEAEAAEAGLRPLVARARATLRRAGIRTTPTRGGGRGPLTAREVEVLELVRSGFTTTEISVALGVATSTVETQIESAMRRLDARTRTQAAAMLGALAS